MKKYGWQAAYLSFFSRDLYREVAQNWRGVGYIYLTLLIAALSAISAVGVQVAAMTMIGTYADPIVAKLPQMTFTNGVLSIDKPSPYIIEANNNIVVDFDMSADPKLPEGKNGWLISKNGLKATGVGVSSESDRSVLEFDKFSTGSTPFVVDSTMVQGWLQMFKSFVGIMYFIFKLIIWTIMCMFQSLIYGLIGLIVANIMKVQLSFAACVRIAVVALSPSLIVDTLGTITMHPIQAWGLISILVGIGYTVFGVAANKGASEPGGPSVAAV